MGCGLCGLQLPGLCMVLMVQMLYQNNYGLKIMISDIFKE
jgi:hypothetical protein